MCADSTKSSRRYKEPVSCAKRLDVEPLRSSPSLVSRWIWYAIQPSPKVLLCCASVAFMSCTNQNAIHHHSWFPGTRYLKPSTSVEIDRILGPARAVQE